MSYSRKISSVKPSATLGITSKAKALRASGEDVVILAAGEPDFDTPDIIKKAAIEAINKGKTKYTPARGTKSLREAICRKLSADNMLTYTPEQIVVSNGAKHSIYNALQVICNDGDEVMIIPPYWLSYPEMIKLAGGRPTVVPASKDNGFKANPEDIKKTITGRTRALILNSPSNPAGVVYSEEDLKKIAEICIDNDILVISDEIYEKIIFDDKEHVSIASVSEEAKANTILVNGVSKSYSMTGWRIGYMAADNNIIDMVSTLQSHATSNPCSISQEAAECALTSEELPGVIKNNCEEFSKRRDYLISRLNEDTKLRPLIPSGAFYAFCDISAFGLDSTSFAQRLLDEKKVVVIPGGPFGEDNFIRISFAASMDTIEKGIDMIKEWTESAVGV